MNERTGRWRWLPLSLLAGCRFFEPAVPGPDRWSEEIEAALAAGELPRAERVAREAVQRHAMNARVLWAHAQVEIVAGRPRVAARDLLELLVTQPEDRRRVVHGWIGDLLFGMGQYANSAVHLAQGADAEHTQRWRALAELCTELPAIGAAPGFLGRSVVLPIAPGQPPRVTVELGGNSLQLAIDTGSSWTVVAQGRTHRAGIKRVLAGGKRYQADGRMG
jgi:hypothetical protein